MRGAIAIAGLGVGLACSLPAAFVCESDAECMHPGGPGTCESGGFCSFPDETCPSGRRYGAYTPAALAEQCVPEDEPSTSSTSTAPGTGTTEVEGTSSESGEDTLALTSGASTTTTTGASTGVLDESGSSSTGAPADPDLVLWLTFDDPDNPFADSSSYGRAVVCDAEGAACPDAAVPGPMANAAVFDGTDDLLEIPHDPDLETDAGLTVALFVRNDLLSALPIRTVIARPYGMGSDNSWELFYRDQNSDGDNDLVFEIADSDGQVQLVVPPLAAKGEWQHVAAIWSVGEVSLYLDGELQASAPAAEMLFDGASVRVAADSDAGEVTHYFMGAVADVRIYRRALDEAEIAALQ